MKNRMYTGLVLGALLAVQPHPATPARLHVEYIPHDVLREVPPGVGMQPVLDVRMATDEDLSVIHAAWREEHKYLSIGAGVASTGLLMALTGPATLYSSAQVAGGIILLPALAAWGIRDQRISRVLGRTVEQADIPAGLYDIIDARLESGQSGSGDAPRMQILVLAFGLVVKNPDLRNKPVLIGDANLCLVLNADIMLTGPERELYHDVAILEPYTRSRDAIAPVCASGADFAEDDGRLLKQSITVYLHSLATVIEQRLPVLSWKN